MEERKEEREEGRRGVVGREIMCVPGDFERVRGRRVVEGGSAWGVVVAILKVLGECGVCCRLWKRWSRVESATRCCW